MATNNTTPPTLDELQQFVEARLKITIDHYTYYRKFHTDTRVVENEIRMLEALKQIVIERKTQKQTIEGDCDRCGEHFGEVMRFPGHSKYRCAECMQIDGICAECGEYMPIPDDDDEDSETNYAPSVCKKCEAQ